jgi:hypothetical protein
MSLKLLISATIKLRQLVRPSPLFFFPTLFRFPNHPLCFHFLSPLRLPRAIVDVLQNLAGIFAFAFQLAGAVAVENTRLDNEVIVSSTARSEQVELQLVNQQAEVLNSRLIQQAASGKPPGSFAVENEMFSIGLEMNRYDSALAQEDLSIKLRNAVGLVALASQSCANQRARAASAALRVLKMNESARVCGKAVSHQSIVLSIILGSGV